MTAEFDPESSLPVIKQSSRLEVSGELVLQDDAVIVEACFGEHLRQCAERFAP